MTTEIKLPDLGEGIEKADVVSVLVAEGDVIQAGQNVVELETDKAVVEVPCEQGGKVTKIHVAAGDSLTVGSPILTLDESAEAPPQKEEAPAPSKEEPQAVEEKPAPKPEKPAPKEKEAEPTPAPQEKKEPVPVTAPAPSAHEDERPPAPAGPATRRLARMLGVDLHLVKGSGPGGRILQEDVQEYVKQAMTSKTSGTSFEAPPLPDFSKWGTIERQPLSRIRKKTAENMSLAWHMAPRVTQYDLADITELEAVRKKHTQSKKDQSGKITVTILALKAVLTALQEYPQFNSSLDTASEQLILKKYYHLGVAVDTNHGLLVPVIRNVDQKSVQQLAIELEALAGKARDRKLALDEMQGGTFTITNLGGIGGTAFSPIVNYPEVAILGIARGRKEQVVQKDDTVQIRLMLPLCLSYDHRVIDGADGARFLKRICELLADPIQLLL